ncbi:MAG: DUF1573 domain-containing protein [bacterium]
MNPRALPIFGLVLAASAFAAGAGPRIEVEGPDYSFGKVPADRAVEHVFKVRNAGTKPLVVSRVQTSCGCTAAMMESSVVEPGKTGKLRVSFNPHNQHASVTRTVTIYSNDERTPTLQLKVSADVVAPGDERKPDVPVVRAHPKEAALAFTPACLRCHGPAQADESGAKLYASACAKCHGAAGEGVSIEKEKVAPSLRLNGMSVRSPDGIRQVIAAGTGHPHKPGFSRAYGGPLSDKQIASLVELITKQFASR